MENSDVAQILAEVADLLDLTGGNPFKVRAYRQAAQTVELLPTPISELWREGKLTELPSIGEHIAQHIEEFLSTGHFQEHDTLLRKVPPGLLELLKVEGLGPKTAAAAWKKLRVKDLDGFELACRNGRSGICAATSTSIRTPPRMRDPISRSCAKRAPGWDGRTSPSPITPAPARWAWTRPRSTRTPGASACWSWPACTRASRIHRRR